MVKTIGIIRETKNEWERRTPLTPADVHELINSMPLNVLVQSSPLRIFEDRQYTGAGAEVSGDLRNADIIFGIKEIKIRDLIPAKVYLFFSHTIKGQVYNMPMLKKMMDLKCTLIDYEKIMNDNGQRLIYFSLHAGLAGIVETLWSFGRVLNRRGIINPFENFRQTYTYSDLGEIKSAFGKVAAVITKDGLPGEICPVVIGVTGYGNVARGVHELLDMLPVTTLAPEDLGDTNRLTDRHKIYMTVFREIDMVEPVNDRQKFELQDYYDHPEKYRSKFSGYLPHLSILVNATYWDTPYPRHVTRKDLAALIRQHDQPKLCVIGDISCDINGGIEITYRATDPGNPVYTYHPLTDRFTDGFTGDGIVIMAVDNLPSELPKNASEYFSGVLKTLVPDLVKADYSASFDQLDLPSTLKDAVIIHSGEFTPGYAYLQEYLKGV
jgi:saccharopine dehydrogenase (NAD+, L-lysine-forming)